MTMREKIARALSRVGWDNESRGGQAYGFEQADAALDALMEPTVSMESAGTATGETDSADGDVCKIFCAMIRAAKDGK